MPMVVIAAVFQWVYNYPIMIENAGNLQHQFQLFCPRHNVYKVHTPKQADIGCYYNYGVAIETFCSKIQTPQEVLHAKVVIWFAKLSLSITATPSFLSKHRFLKNKLSTVKLWFPWFGYHCSHHEEPIMYLHQMQSTSL